MKKERNNMNAIRLALSPYWTGFRINTGRGWTGNDIQSLPSGALLLQDPRPFSTGTPTGFPDLFGLVPVTITPEMVGQTLGVFAAIEVKSDKGKPSDAQSHFLEFIRSRGGFAGVARSVADALAIIKRG